MARDPVDALLSRMEVPSRGVKVPVGGIQMLIRRYKMSLNSIHRIADDGHGRRRSSHRRGDQEG